MPQCQAFAKKMTGHIIERTDFDFDHYGWVSENQHGSLSWGFKGSFLNEKTWASIAGQRSAAAKELRFLFESNSKISNTSEQAHQEILADIKNLRLEHGEHDSASQ